MLEKTNNRLVPTRHCNKNGLVHLLFTADLPHLSAELPTEKAHKFRFYEPRELFQNWGLHFPKFPPNHSCIQLIFIELIRVPGIMLNTGDGMASKTLWTKDNQIFSSGYSNIETNCKDIFKQTF